MSVNASMMMNFIQAASVQETRPVTKTNETSSKGEDFRKLLADVSKEQDTTTASKAPVQKNETVSSEEIVEMIESFMENGMGNGKADEEVMTALLQLLMGNVEEEETTEVVSSDSKEVSEEAMSLMSILMNMGMTAENESVKQESEKVSLNTTVSMVEMATRLNEVLQAVSSETSEQVVETTTENFVLPSDEESKPTLPFMETNMNSEAGKEVVAPVTQATQELVKSVVVSEETSDKSMVMENGPKPMETEVEIVAVKETKTSELNDFEKAYREMQAYRMNANPTKTVEVPTEVEQPKEAFSVSKSDVLNQISENMKTLNSLKDEFIIKLKPEGLGEIVVKLQSESNGKNILSLVVSNQNVKNILESDLQGLKAALSNSHVEVKEVVYDDQSQYFQQSNFMEGNGFYQQREQSNQAGKSHSYQFESDESDVSIQETVAVQEDSLIHQYV